MNGKPLVLSKQERAFNERVAHFQRLFNHNQTNNSVHQISAANWHHFAFGIDVNHIGYDDLGSPTDPPLLVKQIEQLFGDEDRDEHSHLRHHVILTIDGLSILLIPNKEIKLMTTVTVGHTASLSISFLDANGNPMLTAPTPDAVPVWSAGDATIDTLTASADGLTAQDVAIAAGSDTVSMSVVVGGATFAATLALVVQAPPQVLTSVAINVDSVS